MHRGHPLEMATMVGLSQGMDVEHDYDPATGDIALIFRDQNELILNCTRNGFNTLAQAVHTATGIIAADPGAPSDESE